MHAEQLYTGLRVAQSGDSVVVSPPNEEQFAKALQTMTSSDESAQAARHFAESHADFDPSTQIARIADRIDEIIGNRKQEPADDL